MFQKNSDSMSQKFRFYSCLWASSVKQDSGNWQICRLGGGGEREREMPIEAAEPYIWLPENQWISPVLEFGFEMLDMRHPKKLTQILHQEHCKTKLVTQIWVAHIKCASNLLPLSCQRFFFFFFFTKPLFFLLDQNWKTKILELIWSTPTWEIDNAGHQDQVLDHPVLANLLRLLCQSQETQVINLQGGGDPWAASFCDPLLA